MKGDRASAVAAGALAAANERQQPAAGPRNRDGNRGRLAVALAWSGLDRAPQLPVVVGLGPHGASLHARRDHAGTGAQIVPSQFAISSDYLVLPVAEHNPRDLLWAFMGACASIIFSGAVEVAARCCC